MAKALHLFCWFCLACISHSFLVWMSGLHPILFSLVITFYLLLIVAWVVAWIVDDALISLSGWDQYILYGALIGFAATGLFGAALTWILQ